MSRPYPTIEDYQEMKYGLNYWQTQINEALKALDDVDRSLAFYSRGAIPYEDNMIQWADPVKFIHSRKNKLNRQREILLENLHTYTAKLEGVD